MDTQGIIEKLVTHRGQPLTTLAKKQAAISVQVSALGALMSALDALCTPAKILGTNGLSAITASGSYSDFTVSGAPRTPVATR